MWNAATEFASSVLVKRLDGSAAIMKKTNGKPPTSPEMRREYDFSHAVRGKYAAKFSKDAVMVVLDPDVAAVFSTGKQVNDALRAIANIMKRTRKSARLRRSS